MLGTDTVTVVVMAIVTGVMPTVTVTRIIPTITVMMKSLTQNMNIIMERVMDTLTEIRVEL